ncbi:hypothetical protein AMATHDRAFT_72639 [Amanita thiersii Skay4041]|uniref:Ion transport domain-containing protein n=1 Tax=Amanita thiersii Skay4041 TaxID=703135 RepID=A0A2A9P1Z7_9AGAR|nr:hypothetical protein AMATHDRAFT_72639 [Amanita thiersii Skay4041]
MLGQSRAMPTSWVVRCSTAQSIYCCDNLNSWHMLRPERHDDVDYAEEDGVPQNAPTRSIYTLTRSEIMKGVANRFVHSRTYIFFYLGMAALSVTTVILSLTDGCPGLPFYILEVIINTAMILEVGIRFVAFGRQFWRSPFNVMDLVLTVFCALTLLVLVFARCGVGSRGEELFDTLLLIARNVLQLGRLAAVMRQSGQSIFSQPKPIDINAARRGGIGLDIGMDSDSEDEELGQPLVGDSVVFDMGVEQQRARAMEGERDSTDMWAALG